MQRIDDVHQRFSRLLSPICHGTALWDALPDTQACERGIGNLEVGDVLVQGFGDTTTKYGFNLLLPVDHPKNRRAPKGFKPLELNPITDLVVNRSAFKAPSLYGATNHATKPLKFERRYMLFVAHIH